MSAQGASAAPQPQADAEMLRDVLAVLETCEAPECANEGDLALWITRRECVIEKVRRTLGGAPMTYRFRAKCDPEANGRKPQPGDYRWTPWFELEDGGTLMVDIGREGREAMVGMFAEEVADDVIDTAVTGRPQPFSEDDKRGD